MRQFVRIIDIGRNPIIIFPVKMSKHIFIFFSHEMLGIINYAKSVYYNNKREWNKIVDRAMKKDFSWSNSARKYEELYKNIGRNSVIIFPVKMPKHIFILFFTSAKYN